MTHEIDDTYRKFISDKLANSSQKIAELWLDKLDEIIDEPIRDIFPTELLLDHIPSLIRELAKVLASPENELAVTSSLIAGKAKELGRIRNKQNATVHQLLREYDLLAAILEQTISDESQNYTGQIDYQDCIKMMASVAHVVRMILQATVDEFVYIYMERIDDQTERLASFNSFVSHELRKPLQAALLNSELLLEDKKLDQENTKELLIVKNSIQKAASLLKNVGELTEVDQGKGMSPVNADVHVATLVNDIEMQLEDMLTAQNVVLTKQENLGSVVTNAAKLELILTNLINNAVKYCDPDKAKRIINISHDSDASMYRLNISDNGLGIEEDMQDKVFDLHVRAHENHASKKNTDGHGLGLYLVREAAGNIGGRVEMTSTVGEGTSFTIILPKNIN